MRIYVPLQIISLNADGFHPLVDITLNGKPFTLVIDTGASKTALDKDLLLSADKKISLNTNESLSTGLGTNTMQSYTAMVDDFCIGDLKITGFEVAVLDLSTINIAYAQMGHPEVLGVLGGDLLMRHKAVINYGKKTISFKV
ncbi:MAG: retropepsin-like aspartic protease [Mucilaginibacter sp.]